MNIIVFGASGLLGTRLVTEALGRGHEVTAVARDRARLSDQGGRVATVSADATDAAAVAAVAAGHDAALSAVTQHEQPDVLVDVARGLLEGLSRAGVGRLVVAGGAGSLRNASGQRLLDAPGFHDDWKPEALAQADALKVFEGAETDVEWSYLSPGAILAPGERTGSFRLGADEALFDAQGRSSISMEDFAVAMIDELEQPEHPRQRFTAAY